MLASTVPITGFTHMAEPRQDEAADELGRDAVRHWMRWWLTFILPVPAVGAERAVTVGGVRKEVGITVGDPT